MSTPGSTLGKSRKKPDIPLVVSKVGSETDPAKVALTSPTGSHVFNKKPMKNAANAIRTTNHLQINKKKKRKDDPSRE